MGWFGKYGERHPLSVALGLVLLYLIYFALPAAFSSSSFGRGETHDDVASIVSQMGGESLLAASVLGAILLLGWAHNTRLVTPVRRHGLPWLIPPVLFLLGLGLLAVAFMAGVPAEMRPQSNALASLVVTVLLVGLFEELLFRGVLFHGLEAKTNAVTALVVSSLIFGLMHYVNWIGGQSFGDTTIQVIHAAAGGFLYGAIMLMTGSIWPGILLHGTWDAIVSVVSTIAAAEIDVTNVDTDSLHVIDTAASGSGFGDFIANALIGGFEPIYGFIILYVWLRQRRANEGTGGISP